MSKYLKKTTPPPGVDMYEVNAEADELATALLDATVEVGDRIGSKIADAIRRGAPASGNTRSHSLTFNTSAEREALKALAGNEAELWTRKVADQFGVANSDEAERLAIVENWFRASTSAQLRGAGGRPEMLNRLQAFDSIVSKAAMAGGVDTSGGYAVPNIVGAEVLKIIRDASLVYGRCKQVPMTSDTLNYPDEATAVSIYWSAEAASLTGGEPVFGQKQLLAKKIIGRATFSLELLEDSNVAILPFLQSCFAEKIGGELDFQAMEGTGSPFTGVSGATSVNDCARTNGTTGCSLTYASTATTAASLVQIFTKAAESYTRRDGIFVCNPGVYAQIIGLTDTNGQPIVRLGTVEGAPNGTLFGRPIVVSNRLPNTTVGAGTNSVGSLYFGPPSALLFGVRTNLRWDISDQVSWGTYSADARLVGRFGYSVGVPAAWAKQAAIRV